VFPETEGSARFGDRGKKRLSMGVLLLPSRPKRKVHEELFPAQETKGRTSNPEVTPAENEVPLMRERTGNGK
jgi:hypothetical protein